MTEQEINSLLDKNIKAEKYQVEFGKAAGILATKLWKR